MSDEDWRRRLLDELSDPLAFGIAEATGVLTYGAGAELGQALGAGASVLVVRAAIGLWRPAKPSAIPPIDVLTEPEQRTARLIGRRVPDEEIADERHTSTEEVRTEVERIIRKLGYRTRADVGSWARYRWPPPQPPGGPILPDRPAIRMTLMAGSFIGIGWTSYQIFIQLIRPFLCARFGIAC